MENAMPNEVIPKIVIDELLESDAGQKIRKTVETISAVQKGLYALATNEDDTQLDILKIGTVFQIFFIDILASGKRPEELTKEDWESIAEKVNKYAVLEEGQRYSEFVFSLYANYIDISVKTLQGRVSDKNLEAIQDLAETIRANAKSLKQEKTGEAEYVEACLWLSLEAMIKLLSCYFTIPIPEGYAEFIQSVTQLAFEYGRYVLYAREHEILEFYIQNQRVLDEQLQSEYEAYLEELKIQAESFHELIDDAFSANIADALLSSAALARAAGVKEENILDSIESVDTFFLN